MTDEFRRRARVCCCRCVWFLSPREREEYNVCWFGDLSMIRWMRGNFYIYRCDIFRSEVRALL